MQGQIKLRTHGGCYEPPILEHPPFAPIAFAAEHLQVAQFKREFRVLASGLDVIDDELGAVAPFGLSVYDALRPAAVSGGIGQQGLVADVVPLGGAVEGSMVEDLDSCQHGETPVNSQLRPCSAVGAYYNSYNGKQMERNGKWLPQKQFAAQEGISIPTLRKRAKSGEYDVKKPWLFQTRPRLLPARRSARFHPRHYATGRPCNGPPTDPVGGRVQSSGPLAPVEDYWQSTTRRLGVQPGRNVAG